MKSKFNKLFNMVMEDCQVIKESTDGIKYFRNGGSFNRYARYRYGYANVAKMWKDPEIVSKSGQYAIRFNEALADEKYGQLTDDDRANWKRKNDQSDRDEYGQSMYEQERRQEQMMDYIHSGAGLENYYKDRDAGYLD